MKQTIVLTESDLKQKVLDIASKMLKEWASKYQCEEPYYKFKDSVDELIDAFYQDFDGDNSEEIKNAIEAVKNAVDKVDRVVNHPEGNSGDMKIWHNVGF